jgi:hypothetical protein
LSALVQADVIITDAEIRIDRKSRETFIRLLSARAPRPISASPTRLNDCSGNPQHGNVTWRLSRTNN